MHDTFTNSQSSHLFLFTLRFEYDAICAFHVEPMNHSSVVTLFSRRINSPALHWESLFQDAELRKEVVASSGE